MIEIEEAADLQVYNILENSVPNNSFDYRQSVNKNLAEKALKSYLTKQMPFAMKMTTRNVVYKCRTFIS